MDWAAASRFLGALIDLILLEKKLDLLEKAKDEIYELAQKQVDLARTIINKHLELLNRQNEYLDIANNAPIHEPEYSCAMSLANTDVINANNRAMNASLDTTDMYSEGLRRDFIESAMGNIVYSSSGQWPLAYRSESDLALTSRLSKYQHMVTAVNSNNMFIAYNAFQQLAQNSVNLAASSSRLAEAHLTSFVTGVTDWVAGPSKDTGNHTTLSDRIRERRLSEVYNTSTGRGAPVEERVVGSNRNQNRTTIKILPGSNQESSTTFNSSTNGSLNGGD